MRRAVLIVVVLVGLLAGCDEGHHFVGPSTSVQNDSGRAVVVRVGKMKWSIGADEVRHLRANLPTSHWEGPPTTFEILDAASCQVVDSVAVDFPAIQESATIIVPVTGPATAHKTESQPLPSGRVGGEAALERNACVGPADGWSVSVVNRSAKAYYLATTASELGGPVGYLIEVPPDGIGVLEWGGSTGDLYAGAIQLLDRTSCQVLETVEHPAWGNFVVTVDESGEMSIGPGPWPTDGVALESAGFQCSPVRATRAPRRPCDVDITISGAYEGRATVPITASSSRVGDGGVGLAVSAFLNIPQKSGASMFVFSLEDSDGPDGPATLHAMFGDVTVFTQDWRAGIDPGHATLAPNGSGATFDLEFGEVGVASGTRVVGSMTCP